MRVFQLALTKQQRWSRRHKARGQGYQKRPSVLQKKGLQKFF